MDTYKHEPTDKLLAFWENENRDKHDEHCHDQRKHFSPFVLSLDGILGKEA